MSGPFLYSDLADWFHLLTAPEEYAEEAEEYRGVMLELARRPIRTLLELGSGGGNNASHLKRHFEMTLTDLSPAMLAVSRRINLELPHVQGDMRTVRLGRRFDAVLIHDAVMYITSEADLRRVAETAFIHTETGGVTLIVPDCTAETWAPQVGHGGHDGDGRSLRYLEWWTDPDPSDNLCRSDMAIMLREGDGPIRVVHEVHDCGLFPRQLWLDVLTGAGFEASDRPGPDGSTVFAGVRP